MNQQLASFLFFIICIFYISGSLCAESIDVGKIKIFGVTLNSATQKEIRDACKSAGMSAPFKAYNFAGTTIDTYKVNGQLSGAEELMVAFADDTGELVILSYKFSPEMTMDDVTEIVTAKYGSPGETIGSIRSFPRHAFWPSQNATWTMSVSQYDPGENVSLSYYNEAAHKRAARKALADDHAKKMERTKTQSEAF